MSLTSSSTLAEVQAAYDDNADYDVENDTAKCKLFIQACRIYLRRMVNRADHGAASVWDDYEKVEAELKAAKAWLQANDSTAAPTVSPGSIRHVSFENFRR